MFLLFDFNSSKILNKIIVYMDVHCANSVGKKKIEKVYVYDTRLNIHNYFSPNIAIIKNKG